MKPNLTHILSLRVWKSILGNLNIELDIEPTPLLIATVNVSSIDDHQVLNTNHQNHKHILIQLMIKMITVTVMI